MRVQYKLAGHRGSFDSDVIKSKLSWQRARHVLADYAIFAALYTSQSKPQQAWYISGGHLSTTLVTWALLARESSCPAVAAACGDEEGGKKGRTM